MEKIELQTETCLSCNNFRFCLVHWGAECKRQGGKKIPRTKAMPVKEKKEEDKRESKKHEKPRNKTIEMVEPIRTKVANW